MSKSQCVLEDVDSRAAALPEGHAHDVEANVDVREPSRAEIGPGESFQAPSLVPVDGVRGRAIVASGPGLDLDDDERLAVPGDDVDLPQPAPPAPLQDLVASPAELADRQILAPASEVRACEQASSPA